MKRLLLALACSGVALAEPKVELTEHHVLGNIYRYGRPFQAQVELSFNEVRSDQLQGPGEVSTQFPVQLGPVSRQYAFPVLHANYGASEYSLNSALPINIVNVGQISIANELDYLVLAMSSSKNSLGYLGGYKNLLKQGEVRVNQPAATSQWPDLWWTYLGQDALVIQDLPSLKLQPSVEKAILQWTQAGGQLVLVTNLDPQEYRGSTFEEYLPLRPEGLKAGKPPLITGQVQEGEVVQKHQGQPLLLRRSYGCGQIFQITAAVTQQETLGNALTASLWKEIIRTEATGLRVRKFGFDQDRRLAQLPELPAPATAGLAWFLFGYCAVLLPSIYLYARRRDRVLRLIVYVPVISTLVTLGAYGYNSRGRGRELVQRELGTLYAASGQQLALLDQSAALFSPNPTRFWAKLSESTLLRPESYLHRESKFRLSLRGRELRLEEVRLPQWGISRWRGLAVRQVPGKLSLRSRGQEIEVDNQLGKALSGYLLDSQGSSDLVNFPVGSSRHQTRAKHIPGPMFSLSDGDHEFLWRALDELRTSGPVVVTDLGQDPECRVLQPENLQPRYIGRTLLVVYGD